MGNNDNLLELKNVIVHYETQDGVVEAVNNVSFSLKKGESLGMVGETGAGKTTIALTIMGLLPKPPAHVIRGEIRFKGENLFDKSVKQMRAIRGNDISMIFQDPMTALNPVLTVGDQIAEVVRLHNKMTKAEALDKAKEMLKTVGIPEERVSDYPHQFSGGMKQRVVIAIALACNPELLIADEPTTALDVTIQAQVLQSIKELKEKMGTSLIFITHDFGIVANICEKCAVIYAGEIIEMGTVEQVFRHPSHPYTIGLFESIPKLDGDEERLKPIPGLMSDPMDLPQYCSFYDRCMRRCDSCKNGEPAVVDLGDGHIVKCKLFESNGNAEGGQE
ncbi:MAG: ABC transporter ATP-binding protein [Parasporobacterium sp.]|nr:ABC transporter ATP-binding protein [Parasporobacterium sp.]